MSLRGPAFGHRLQAFPEVFGSHTSRGRRRGADLSATAVLLAGDASAEAAARLARAHPLLHGRLIPWYHRRRGWQTQQYRLDSP